LILSDIPDNYGPLQIFSQVVVRVQAPLTGLDKLRPCPGPHDTPATQSSAFSVDRSRHLVDQGAELAAKFCLYLFDSHHT